MIIDSIARTIQNLSYRVESADDSIIKATSIDTLNGMLKGLYECSKGEEKSSNTIGVIPLNEESVVIEPPDDTQSGNYEQMLVEKNKIANAIVKFNMKPKAGYAYLMQNKMIVEEPEEEKIQGILKFLRENSEIDRGKIGEYFGEANDFNKKVLYTYIESFDFTDVDFVQSVRLLFSDFRPVGESQIMDRILVKFGEKYAKDNPNKFINAGVPYELSYAVMILQTHNHSPQVKKKMTLVLFINRLTSYI